MLVKDNKKTICGWVMYDWANSVFQLTISTAIFPIYYYKVTHTGNSNIISFFGFEIVNTVAYSYIIAAAFLISAIMSPFLSSIADYTGRRKMFMKIFTWIGALSCGSLFFFDSNHIEIGLTAFGMGIIGYGGSIVYYNSFLPLIASSEKQDDVSARGYAMGYLGSVILLIINLLIITFHDFFGITDSTLPVKIAFFSVFLWWIGFSQITFRVLPKYATGFNVTHKKNVILNGYKELRIVFAIIRKSKSLTLYLLGFFFISMGYVTVLLMAAIYGEKHLYLETSTLISIILTIQFVGIAGSILFAKISGKFGNITTLIICTIMWCFICIGAYFITNATEFFIVALLVGLVMGGTQSLARSTYSKMLPETLDHTSFFSFYDVMEKLSTVCGIFSFGLIEALTDSMRNSILSITISFLIGLIFLVFVNRTPKTINPK